MRPGKVPERRRAATPEGMSRDKIRMLDVGHWIDQTRPQRVKPERPPGSRDGCPQTFVSILWGTRPACRVVWVDPISKIQYRPVGCLRRYGTVDDHSDVSFDSKPSEKISLNKITPWMSR